MNMEKFKVLLQGLKFAVVGGANTGIDFLAVNALFWFFRPSGQAGLLLISIASACLAMLNSYFMNKYWSFASKGSSRTSEVSGFLTVSLLGLAVNTSVFLFCAKYLMEFAGIGGFLNVNVSRLFGVACAMGVTFLGYKLGVFDTASVKKFREENGSAWPEGFTPSWTFIASICLSALAVRLLFWMAVPVVYGDSVNYYWVARGISEGSYATVDWFWHSLFTFFEAGIMMLGLHGQNAIMVSSLIPGVLLLIPAYLACGSAFGKSSAMIASAFIIFSPRLIEYSVNGYSESFFLFCIACSICIAVRWISSGKTGTAGAVILGVSSAAHVLVKNESVTVAVAILLFLLLSGIEKKIRNTIVACAFFAVSIAGYIAVNEKISGSTGIFQKSTNISKVYSEQIDWRNAARETYGQKNAAPAIPSSENAIPRAFRHFHENLFYMAERIPGVFFSPLALFIPFAGLLGSSLLGRKKSAAIFLIGGVFPFISYPFLDVEPRMLFLSLLAFTAWGSAGLCIFSVFIAKNFGRKSLSYLFCAVLIISQIPFIMALAWRSNELRSYHKDIGVWLSENTKKSDMICGDGYGYVLSSAFWAGKKPMPRLWTTNPDDITVDMRKKSADILVIYEEFAKLANPEILQVFDSGMAGMKLMKEFKTRRGRVQIYHLTVGEIKREQ